MDEIYASSRGQIKSIMRAPTCKYADSKSGFNDMVGIEIRYRQGNLAVFFYWSDWRYRHPKRSRGIFYALAVLCTYEKKKNA